MRAPPDRTRAFAFFTAFALIAPAACGEDESAAGGGQGATTSGAGGSTTSGGTGGGAEGTPCETAADCRLFSSACGDCACLGLHTSDPDPSCPSGETVSCASDPCELYVPACDSVEKHCVLVKP